jgi:hypothetical protein
VIRFITHTTFQEQYLLSAADGGLLLHIVTRGNGWDKTYIDVELRLSQRWVGVKSGAGMQRKHVTL